MIRPPLRDHGDGPGLPFHPGTILRSLLRRWPVLIVWAGLSAVIAVGAGLSFGSRSFTAETVLLHRPRPSEWIGPGERGPDSLSLVTKMNLVKVRSNLEEVRRRMELPASIPQLGMAIDVFDQRGTDLLVLRAHWGEPAVARGLATTLSDVFLQSQVGIRYREEQAVVDRLWREAQAEAGRIQAQIDNLGRITSDLQSRVAQERADSPEDEGLGQLSIRMSQLRDAINDDQGRRANQALLRQKEGELQRAEELLRREAMTEQEVDLIRAQRDRLDALAVDTEQITQWRRELERLQSVVLPSDGTTTASAPLLQAVMFRALNAEFDLAAAREKVAQYDAVRERMRTKSEEMHEDQLALAGRPSPAWLGDSDFQVVTPARLPILPSRSNRRLVALAAWVGLLGLGVFALLAVELLTPWYRSAPELALGADLPVFGAVPMGRDGPTSAPVRREDHRFRLVAESLTRAVGADGGRVLVASAVPGDGRTRTTAELASALAALGSRVLVLDPGSDSASDPATRIAGDPAEASDNGPCEPHAAAPAARATRWVSAMSTRLKALLPGGWPPAWREARALPVLLGVGTSDGSTASDPRATSVPGVDYLAPGPGSDWSAGRPVGSVLARLDELGQTYDLVLIDGPAALPDAGALALAERVDAVVMVARALVTPRWKMRGALDRLAEADTPILGAVLNGTPRAFLEIA